MYNTIIIHVIVQKAEDRGEFISLAYIHNNTWMFESWKNNILFLYFPSVVAYKDIWNNDGFVTAWEVSITVIMTKAF